MDTFFPVLQVFLGVITGWFLYGKISRKQEQELRRLLEEERLFTRALQEQLNQASGEVAVGRERVCSA